MATYGDRRSDYEDPAVCVSVECRHRGTKEGELAFDVYGPALPLLFLCEFGIVFLCDSGGEG